MYIGIDLGTSNSAVAVHDGKRVTISDPHDLKGPDPVLPSAIYIDRRERKFFGHRAYESLFAKETDAVDGFKRQMGTSWSKKFESSGIVMSAEECSAEVLRQLVGQVRVSGDDTRITGTVVTTPAAFNPMQIEATRRAARAAGIDQVALVQEPVAAALALVATTGAANGLFLIYDIGGGTFDLALAQSVNGKINIVAHEGINALGGRDFDRKIIEKLVKPWLQENFVLPDNFQNHPKYEKLMRIIHQPVEDAKKELSSADGATIYLSEERVSCKDEDGTEIYFEIELARQDYEEWITPYIRKTVDLSQKLLADHGYDPGHIDQVVLIGGPTRTPLIQEMVRQEMGIRVSTDIDPMTAVAVGAAHFCEGLDWSDSQRASKAKMQVVAESGLDVQYRHEARTSRDRTKLRVMPSAETAGFGMEIEVNSEAGWTSGRIPLDGKQSVELPLDDGDNNFKIFVFHANGQVLDDDIVTIVITKVAAMADVIRLTSSISVRIRGTEDQSTDELHMIAEKGMETPCGGIAADFRSAINLTEDGQKLRIEIYSQPEKENCRPGEPNLLVGVCQIGFEDLEGAAIHEGDEIIVHWRYDQDNSLEFDVEVPALGKMFSNKTFYDPTQGEVAYGGKEGFARISKNVEDCKGELRDATAVSSEKDKATLRELREKVSEQEVRLRNSSDDAEERRAIAEEIRWIRQKVLGILSSPENIRAKLQGELDDATERFDNLCREHEEKEKTDRFDGLAKNCGEALRRGTENDRQDARRMLDEMHSIIGKSFLAQPGMVIMFFKHLSTERYLAIDKSNFDNAVSRGRKCLASNDIIPGLLEAVRAILQNRSETRSDDAVLSDLIKK